VVNQLQEHAIPVKSDEKNLLKNLIQLDFGSALKINKYLRMRLLDLILTYYKIHVEGFGNLRSMSILKEVLE
jgi:DNA repair protein RecO (recombination protein O)